MDLGLVRGVFKNSTNNLKHRGDPGSASDHSEFTRQVRGIDKFALGALNPEVVSNLEEGYVTRDVTLLVGLEKNERYVGKTNVMMHLDH